MAGQRGGGEVGGECGGKDPPRCLRYMSKRCYASYPCSAGGSDMEESVVRGIEDQVRSAFADGTIGRVQVLEYGDDPSVEPGEVGIRLLVAFSGAPEDEEAAR